jgi:hypothetical protein
MRIHRWLKASRTYDISLQVPSSACVPGRELNGLGHSKRNYTYLYMCRIQNGFRDKAVRLYNSKTVDKKDILSALPNTSISYSSDNVCTIPSI